MVSLESYVKRNTVLNMLKGSIFDLSKMNIFIQFSNICTALYMRTSCQLSAWVQFVYGAWDVCGGGYWHQHHTR